MLCYFKVISPAALYVVFHIWPWHQTEYYSILVISVLQLQRVSVAERAFVSQSITHTAVSTHVRGHDIMKSNADRLSVTLVPFDWGQWSNNDVYSGMNE